MNRSIVAAALSLAIAGPSLAWADSGQAPSGTDPKIGTRVTITGCLHAGASSGTFVLLGVTERPAGSAASASLAPYAIYWLDSTDGMKALVGEMVDVTGKVKSRRGSPGTIKVSVDQNEDRETKVEVASASGALDVTSKKYDNATPPSPGTSAGESWIEVKRPVYKLDVETVVAANAPLAGPACR